MSLRDVKARVPAGLLNVARYFGAGQRAAGVIKTLTLAPIEGMRDFLDPKRPMTEERRTR